MTGTPISRALVDDCFRPGSPRLRHEEALALLKKRVAPLSATAVLPIIGACGRTLADPITAMTPIPAHTNAAVDGYAFHFTSEIRENGAPLPLAGRASAGHPLAARPATGTAVRIFTGAVMPDGLDTVVMQEDVRLAAHDGASLVHIPAGLKRGANVRKTGEDVAAGSTLFARGDTLRPQDLAALAAVGRATVPVYARVRVGVVSTGDEVISPGTKPLAPGQVYDANNPMLATLAALAGADVETLGIWPDNLQTITQRLAEAASRFDVILTSGGASQGEEDHMATALAAIGTRHLWQIAVKPGRPMMFGQIRTELGGRDTIIVGLPGNPVAVFVCFLMYVFPLLRAAGGAHWREPRRFILPAAFEFKNSKPGRREFWRGNIIDGPRGLTVNKFARDGSGLISGLRASDGLIDIPEEAGDVAIGTPVAFIPYTEFGIA